MSTAGFDELIHAPTRLAIVSLLAAAQWADFKYIRDELGLSDSALIKIDTVTANPKLDDREQPGMGLAACETPGS